MKLAQAVRARFDPSVPWVPSQHLTAAEMFALCLFERDMGSRTRCPRRRWN